MPGPLTDSSAPSLQQLRAARGRPPAFWRRHRWLLGAAGLLGAVVLLGFFGLPPIVRAQAVKRLSASLGRAVTIERVRLNPLEFSVALEGLAVAEAAPDAAEFIGWRRFYANLDSWSLLTGRVCFQEIALDGLRARVFKSASGGLNFDDILVRLAGAEPTPAGAKPARPPALRIRRLEVTDARVAFRDASRERPFATEAGPVSFLLEEFHTVGDPDSPYHFEAVTGAGERLAWRGTLSADPIQSKGELVLENIDLARFSPYYHDVCKGELRSAFLDVAGEFTLDLKGGAPFLRLGNGAVTLRDVRFGAPGVAEDALAIRRLAINAVSADSASLRADIGKIAIEGVRLKATLEAAGLDLARLLEPAFPARQPAVDKAGVAPDYPAIKLAELSLSDVQAELVDLTAPRRVEHRVEGLSLVVRGIDTEHPAASLPCELEVTLPRDGRIAVAGTVAAQPLAADLELTLERIALAGLSPYVESIADVRLVEGAVRARGRATLRESSAVFAGDFGLAGLRLVDGKLAEDLVKWADLAVTGIRASSAPAAFHADEIRLVEPGAAVRIDADGSLAFNRTGGPQSVTAAPPVPPPPALPLTVDIGRIRFERGAFRFEDRSIRPFARGGISDFEGYIAGLSSEARGRADLALQGKFDGLAPVSVKGSLNPLGRPAFMDLVVDLKGIDLQPGAGPYIGKFAGRSLTSGNLGLAVKARLDDRLVDLDNVVTLDRFYLGETTQSPDATTLPVGLALALLRDSGGRIVIDLPVRGSLDDPNFRIGRVVLRVFSNLLVKAATSPFSLLGAAFGGGSEELGYLDFAAGSAELDEAARSKLATVAKALAGRPALQLDIVGAFDPVADGQALGLARLEREVRTAAWEARRQVDVNTPPPEELSITPELRAGMLARLYAVAFPVSGAGLPPGPGAVAAKAVLPAENQPAAAVARADSGGLRRSLGPRSRFYGRGRNEWRPEAARGLVPAGAAAPEAVGPELPVLVEEVTEAGMEARLVERMAIPRTELEALATARALAVRGCLLEGGKVAAERITLVPSAPAGLRINLALK